MVTRFEIRVIVETFNELNTRRATETAGAASRHGVGRVLGGALTALVSTTCGRWGITSLKARTRLTVAPGQR
ncbi:hypothetical protein GOODEAATRI_024721 [Goodea atripinnis]|uniref:Uncharacterized protein n=1 Tax=Goodea atripinnis TaxID=208336 RepID=A0ABV0MKI2_9TELE